MMTNNVKQEELLNAFMKKFRTNALVDFKRNGEVVAYGWEPSRIKAEVKHLINQQVVQALGTHSTEYGKWDGAQADNREQVKYEETQLNKSKGE